MILEPSRRACEVTLWGILLFAPAAFGSTEWWSQAVIEALIFLLAAMCTLQHEFSSTFTGPLCGLALIVAAGVLQFLFSTSVIAPSSLVPFTLSRAHTAHTVFLWMAYCALLWSTVGILRWQGALRRLLWAIFIIGLFIAIVGILQRGQGNRAYYGLRPIRHGHPFGPFTNYDHAASWMVISSFIGFGLFWECIRSARGSISEYISKLLLITFAIVVEILAVWETGSRGAINSAFASGLLTLFLLTKSLPGRLSRRCSRTGLVLIVLTYAALLYFNPIWLGFANGTLDNSTAYRISMYRSGLEMLADFPIFGAGLGSFSNAFYPYQESIVVGLVDHIHSSWFELSLEVGLVGFVIFSAPVFGLLIALGKRLHESDFPARWMAAGCFAAWCAFAIHSLIEFNLQIPANAILFFVLVGAGTVLCSLSFKSAVRSVQTRDHFVAGALLIMALIALPSGFTGWMPRYGAPFALSNDTLLPFSRAEASDLSERSDLLRYNPVDPRVRTNLGATLWEAGRVRDAQMFMGSDGK